MRSENGDAKKNNFGKYLLKLRKLEHNFKDGLVSLCGLSTHTSVSAGVDNPQESSHLGEEALHYYTELRTSI